MIIDIKENIPVYPIGVVRKLTGLSDRQIRYYDKTGLVVPKRTPGKKRMYTPGEVEKLKEIKKFIQKGMTIKEIKEYYAENRKRKTKNKNLQSDAKTYFNRKGKKQTLYPPSYLDELLTKFNDD